MEQLLLHLFGDYVVQNDWMALNKKGLDIKNRLICLLHCTFYALPFLLIGTPLQVLWILCMHYFIDNTTIITKLLTLRNHGDSCNFGFGQKRPIFITVWLNIITDNTFHLIINYLILKYIS